MEGDEEERWRRRKKELEEEYYETGEEGRQGNSKKQDHDNLEDGVSSRERTRNRELLRQQRDDWPTIGGSQMISPNLGDGMGMEGDGDEEIIEQGGEETLHRKGKEKLVGDGSSGDLRIQVFDLPTTSSEEPERENDDDKEDRNSKRLSNGNGHIEYHGDGNLEEEDEEEADDGNEYDEDVDSESGFSRTDSIGLLFGLGGVFSSGDSLSTTVSRDTPVSPRGSNARRKKASDFEENLKARHLWYEQSSILGERMWELAIPLLVVLIFPGTLLPIAIVGICQVLPAVLLAGTVISWVYSANRMLAVMLAIGMQLLSIATSAVAIAMFLFILPAPEPGASSLIASWKTIVCFAALAGSQCFGSLGWIMYSTSVGGDWVPTLFSSEQLNFVNLRMGFIELFCRVCAPVAVGVLFFSLDTKIGFLAIASWSVATCVPAFLFLRWVYRSKTLLAFRQKTFEVLQGNSVDVDRKEADATTATPVLASSTSSSYAVVPPDGTRAAFPAPMAGSLGFSINSSQASIEDNVLQDEPSSLESTASLEKSDPDAPSNTNGQVTTSPLHAQKTSSHRSSRHYLDSSSEDDLMFALKSRPRRMLEAIFSPIITLFNAYRLLSEQQVSLIIFAHSFLWMSVLASSGLLLTAYLKERGYSDLEIALFRCVGALLSVASIFSFPVLERRLGLVVATRIYLMAHAVFVIIAAAMFSFSCCIVPYFLEISSANYISRIMVYIFMVLVVLASFGYYGYYISEAQVIKMAIPEEIQGTITILDTSLTRLGLLVIYIFALFLSHPSRFVYLVAVSAVAGNVGVCLFLFWTWSRSNVNFLMLREFVEDEGEPDSDDPYDPLRGGAYAYSRRHTRGEFSSSDNSSSFSSYSSRAGSISDAGVDALSVNSYPGEPAFLTKLNSKNDKDLRPTRSYVEPSTLTRDSKFHA